jgi:hypothetical protein
MIDYFLKSPAGSVKLEVFDAHQSAVRKFSSEDQGSAKHLVLPVAERWFPKPEALDKTPGMHRFVWSLNWGSSGGPSADEDADTHNPSGPKVIPGIYQLQLTVDGKVYSESLEVVMDPRSPATPELLEQQLQLGKEIFDEAWQSRRVLAEIGSVQKQLADAQVKLGEQKPQLKSALADAQASLAKILTHETHANDQGTGLQDAYLGLASALRVVEGGDRAAPSQAIELYKASSRQVKAGMREWATFKKGTLPALNQELRDSNLAPVPIGEIEQEIEFLMTR